MACHYSRYGFIITDTCPFAFRITRCLVSPGLALGRPRRETAAASGHQRQTSDISMASGAHLSTIVNLSTISILWAAFHVCDIPP
ncbi:hypothetical protein M430DRAFT_197707 [Amorphotheca resinae ATCC 22711]|uniref:Uncharacterized protein n=1 Tax=Amorphotheca resinae ATCC 22711 TaxID=857342 RepID=A0A2T3B9T0_AMORE|nr:hypothetical protein M430DRAFT_197707 [Amorphotheca resinae ATCC 22711]PSS25039.1 hypothetical protein M430DRAFT_197707 [Amorphotheca resinae ATCC 22711]